MKNLNKQNLAEAGTILPPMPHSGCNPYVSQTLDVSSDNEIDWTVLTHSMNPQLGISIRAIIGENQTDENFYENVLGCKQYLNYNGGICGAYAVLYVHDNCAIQGEQFFEAIDTTGGYMTFTMLDVEETGPSTTNTVQNCVSQFLAGYTQSSGGYYGINYIYTNEYFWLEHLANDCSAFNDHGNGAIYSWISLYNLNTPPAVNLTEPCFPIGLWQYTRTGSAPGITGHLDVSCSYQQPNSNNTPIERTSFQRRLLNLKEPVETKSTPPKTAPTTSSPSSTWLSRTSTYASKLLSNAKAAAAQSLITAAVDVGAKVAQAKYGVSKRTTWIGRNVAYYGAMFGLKFMQRAAMAESEELDCQQTMQEAAVDTAILGGINAGLHVSERLGKWAAQKLNDAEWVRSGKCVKAISERLHYLSTGYQMGTSDDWGAQVVTNIAVGAAAQVAGKAALDAVLLPEQQRVEKPSPRSKATP